MNARKKTSPVSVWAILPALTSVLVSCARADRSSQDLLVDIGTHRLEMHREGTGRPAVIIDSGLSDSLDKLKPLQARLARKTLVVTYNRAGYGGSGPGPFPRDAGREAEELKALLEKAPIPGPYILVGHSLGALNMMLFASRHPEAVAGMVLLDPPPLSFLLGQAYPELRAMAEKMTAEWQTLSEAPAASADPGDKAKSAFLAAIASEHREMFGETARQVGAIASFGDLRLVVFAAGKANPAFGAVAEEYQKYWIEQSRDLSMKSTGGRFVLAENSGHDLYQDVPDLVCSEIDSLVDGIRAALPDARTKDLRLKCLETVSRTLEEKYFDPTFGGLDWKSIEARYRPLIAAARSDREFYTLINKMVFELNVSHIGVIPPEESEQLEPVASAEGSLGIDLRLIDGAAVVITVKPGSPGEEMGLRPGFLVEGIGGKTIAQIEAGVERIPPLHERNERKRFTGKIQEQLYGKTGTPVALVYRDGAGERREAAGRMSPRPGRQDLPDKRLPPFFVEFEARRLGDLGYVRFNAFVPPVQDRFAEAVASFRNASGLILDLRGNHGGMFPVRKAVIDRLVPERRLFWSYKGRSGIRDVFAEPAKDTYAGPLVVLVDVMSASSAEEVAGGLQAIGRALIIGERTAGVCLVMDAVNLPNGALFVFPSAQTRTANATVLEERGVIPDLEVGWDRAALLRGGDAQLEAAVQYLRGKNPKS